MRRRWPTSYAHPPVPPFVTYASLRLKLRGLTVERQRVLPVVFKGKRLATQLRVDLIVVGRVVVECKAGRTVALAGLKLRSLVLIPELGLMSTS